MGPLFSLPSFPQLSSFSFVPRLHTVMSRSCLWGAQPGRRLVFRALLFSSSPALLLSPFWVLRLYWCWLITGAFSPLPTACCCCRAQPPTLPATIASSSPLPVVCFSPLHQLGASLEKRWMEGPGYRCVLMKQ